MNQTRRFLLTAGVVTLLSLTFATNSRAGVVAFLTKTSFDTASSTTLLEDFEGFAPKDTPLASFVSNGVTYTGLAGAPGPNVWVASPGYPNFGAGVGVTTTSILTTNGDEDFTMDFSMTPFAVGFDVYLNGLGPVRTTITTTVGSFTLTDLRGLDTKEYYGFVSTDPITSIRFTSTLGGLANTGVDNIAIGSPVPEPTTVALLGAGLVALRARRRRNS